MASLDVAGAGGPTVEAKAAARGRGGGGASATLTLSLIPAGTTSRHGAPGGVTVRTRTGLSARSVVRVMPERAARRRRSVEGGTVTSSSNGASGSVNSKP